MDSYTTKTSPCQHSSTKRLTVLKTTARLARSHLSTSVLNRRYPEQRKELPSHQPSSFTHTERQARMGTSQLALNWMMPGTKSWLSGDQITASQPWKKGLPVSVKSLFASQRSAAHHIDFSKLSCIKPYKSKLKRASWRFNNGDSFTSMTWSEQERLKMKYFAASPLRTSARWVSRMSRYITARASHPGSSQARQRRQLRSCPVQAAWSMTQR